MKRQASIGTGAAQPADDPYHPNSYRPICREVMSGTERLGHLVTDGYHDHNWRFQPDRRFTDRRPTRAKSADPADCLPNWVRKVEHTILSAEESAATYEQLQARHDSGLRRG